MNSQSHNMKKSSQDKMSRETKKTFIIVFFTLILDLLAFTLILPLMPKLLDHYKKHDTSGLYPLIESQLNSVQTFLGLPVTDNAVLFGGLIGSWFSLLQFASSPFFGALSDRYGRKPILLIALIGTLSSYILWYVSSRLFSVFLVARTFAGLSKSNVGLSLAIVTDVSGQQSRGKGMAVVGAAFSLSFIVGPLLGAMFASFNKSTHAIDTITQVPALAATILSLTNLLVVYFFLQETNTRRNVTTPIGDKKTKSPQSSIIDYVSPWSLFSFKLVEKRSSVLDITILRRLGFIYFMYLMLYSGLEFTLTFLTHSRFNFSSMEQGKLYLFSGLIMACLQGGYIRRMKPGKEGTIATAGLFLIIPSFILMGLSTSVAHIYLSLLFYAVSSAVVVPCLTSRASSHCHENHKGVTLGIFRSIGSLARTIGPSIASVCFWVLGSTMTYCIGAALLFIPFMLMLRLEKQSHSMPTRNIYDKNTQLTSKSSNIRPHAA